MPDEQTEQDFVRSLFGPNQRRQLPDDPEPVSSSDGNHVPREGSTAGPDRPADYDDRNFVGKVFGTNPNTWNMHRDPDDDGPPTQTVHL